ncbi:glutaredoxin family protein [Sphingomonas sp. NCPPB 2930]
MPATSRCLAILLVALAASAQAQTLYRIVGPDGRVTYSDRPQAVEGARSAAPVATEVNPVLTASALPYELRTVVQKYPLTLYTGNNCEPCAAARSLLRARGVPFSERTVSTSEDVEALRRLSGDNNLPFATLGSQQIRGFAEMEWTRYLDAAGYPKQSQLPPNYNPPLPTALAPRTAPAAAEQAAPAPRAPAPSPAPAVAAPAPSPSNPAGIRF